MKKNMDFTGRIVEVIIAVVLTTLYFTNVLTGTVGLVLIGLSAVFVLTRLVGYCPLYLPFGLSTLSKKPRHKTP